MSLCNLCENIPWETLSTLPPDLPRGLSGYDYIQAFYQWPKDLRGHPYHQSLDALQQSAVSCHLCRLIQKSAENVKTELEKIDKEWEALKIQRYGYPKWEMWLVKRELGCDGCLVMSFIDNKRVTNHNGGEDQEAWIIGAIGLCVPNDDPLSSIIKGRPVEELGKSKTTIQRAHDWILECNQHTNCNESEMPLPSRIIDVGIAAESPYVRLWDPVPDGFRGKYISLSYCWGESGKFTTTKSNLEDRKARIDIVKMPKTMQDIITLAKALQIQYVWIDALCIYQDNFENWERESAKMQSVYANAYLTVAASRAKESAEGFLGARPKKDYVQLNYNHANTQGRVLAFSLSIRKELVLNEYIDLPDEPLSKRAWGVQERVLSRRMLLYGTDQMFYECCQGYRGEDGVVLPRRFENIHDGLERENDSPEQQSSKSSEIDGQREDALHRWYNLLWLYGEKKLSNPSDKLPAISGLAKIYAKHIGGQYLAGLWRDRLLEGLIWQSLQFRRVTKYRAPSWSWASGDGIPATGFLDNFEEIAEVLDAQVTLKGTNPFGEVIDGSIRLRAPLEQLFLILDDWDPESPDHEPYDNNVKIRTKTGSPEGDYSRFDFAFTDDDAPQEAKRIVDSLRDVEIFALILIKTIGNEESEDESTTYHSLIIRKVPETSNYQRLGFLLSDKEMLSSNLEAKIKTEMQEIVLV